MATSTIESTGNAWHAFIGGALEAKIKISDQEVTNVIDAASPTASLASLMILALGGSGPVGPIIGAISASTVYLLKNVNNKYGKRGVTIRFRCGPGMGLESLTTLRVWSPDA